MTRFTDLPLFASDAELAEAVLGKKDAHLWEKLVPLYERRGLQKIDPETGKRYTQKVKEFFDFENGVKGAAPPLAPLGRERDVPWDRTDRRRRA